ncbi:MAG TPA: efflux RND transporter periplasmic adaptor subunit [Negativicutes bacterium]|nr:efflux RND transporter periplasmic adaptor subunit [Negativicutes bacterium]
MPVRTVLQLSKEYIKTHKLQTIVCLVLVFSAGVYWYGQRSNSTNKNLPVVPTVEYVTVKRSDLSKKIELAGKTVSDAQIDIATKYGGRVKTIRASLGQEVKQGDVLLVLDTTELEILISQARAVLEGAAADLVEGGASFNANYAKAQSDYNLSVLNYHRYQNLFAQGAVSKVALETIEQQMNATKATLDSMANQFIGGRAASVLSKQANRDKAKAALDALLAQKDEMTLKAPRDGIVGFRQAEEGSLVVAGQKLLAVVDNRNLYVDCTASEQDVGFLSLQKSINVFIEAVGQTVKSDVIYISPAMDPATQSFVVRLLITEKTDSIKAGLFAKTALSITLKPNTLFVPKEAILSQTGKTKVFVIDEQNKVREQIVITGLKNDLMVEIDGVNPGDKVAVSNLSRLRSGLVVKATEVTQ